MTDTGQSASWYASDDSESQAFKPNDQMEADDEKDFEGVYKDDESSSLLLQDKSTTASSELEIESKLPSLHLN